jgi:putative membrane protein
MDSNVYRGPVRTVVRWAGLALIALPTWAHEGAPLTPQELWTAWEFDPFVVAGLVLTAVLYGHGDRPGRGIRSWERWCFWTGWVTLIIALVSPLHLLGEVLFSAHMAQHEVLMTLSAPLIVLGRPLVPFVWALPEGWRRPVGRATTRGWWATVWKKISSPLGAWLLHFVALWGWHIPVLFEATLISDFVHSLQHISFFATALLFWWALLCGHGHSRIGLGVFYLFTTVIHTGLLGALLTFSERLWYPLYAATTAPWGLTPLEDQQLGGLIMWIPASASYVIAGLALMGVYLRESDEGAVGTSESRAVHAPTR